MQRSGTWASDHQSTRSHTSLRVSERRPIFSAFGYHSQISFRVQLMSRHHARKRYMSCDLKGYVLWCWNHKPEHLMCVSCTMREGGLLTEMSHAAAFSTWLSPMTLPPLQPHPTLFLHERHLGFCSSHHARCERDCYISLVHGCLTCLLGYVAEWWPELLFGSGKSLTLTIVCAALKGTECPMVLIKPLVKQYPLNTFFYHFSSCTCN